MGVNLFGRDPKFWAQIACVPLGIGAGLLFLRDNLAYVAAELSFLMTGALLILIASQHKSIGSRAKVQKQYCVAGAVLFAAFLIVLPFIVARARPEITVATTPQQPVTTQTPQLFPVSMERVPPLDPKELIKTITDAVKEGTKKALEDKPTPLKSEPGFTQGPAIVIAQAGTPQVAQINFTTKRVPSTIAAAPYALQVILQTSVSIRGARFLVRCTAGIYASSIESVGALEACGL